ncbi:MAG: hypothetical protein EXR99_13905 [Gemmataceae bacterium]|nr:hypothetical protein [Gemmataceae bacterium]
MNEVMPVSAGKTLEQHYLEARCRLLDLAAIFDRIDRGHKTGSEEEDPRLVRLREGLKVLQESKAGRAEQMQRLFSLPYDPEWEKPKPRY